ncbi:aspartyl-phosphate phosphatase Spo0E family protein [Paenibacillus herberti]|uniref:Aspartyl-phosphate phosphatase Spo0E family protein n=1 Tax=Paenibacillus herberti TaxID=1619309 RepID=A0A229NU61_9BACL|nr:aspartyl-phosphate phosphatase Spo0E family protein [Paenibacillus herberti]OXM13199.1 aspartyl-phosphate phosphatase Spo0E family protein [Paenibacillus herberti]
MDMNLTRIRDTIERKRLEMIQAAERCGHRTEHVLRLSQELDMLLNEYERLRQRREVWLVS